MTNYEWLLQMGGEERQVWFDAEHVDANDTLSAENDVRADDVCANDVDASQDSREKLEEDVHQYANPSGFKGTLGACWEKEMLSFLDRQAAIDRKEFQSILEEIQTCMRNGSR